MATAKSFVCFCIVDGFEKEDSLENLHSVLFRLIKKRSVQPFACFWSFSERRQSALRLFPFCSKATNKQTVISQEDNETGINDLFIRAVRILPNGGDVWRAVVIIMFMGSN